MTTRTRFLAEYLAPGAFMSESYGTRELAEPTTEQVLEHQPNENWFGARVSSVTEKMFRASDGEVAWVEENRPQLIFTVYNYGEIFDLERVKALGAGYDILVSNMEGNKWPRVVRTRLGNWQPLEDEDVVLGAE